MTPSRGGRPCSAPPARSKPCRPAATMPSPTMSIAFSAAGAMPGPDAGRRGEDIMRGSMRALVLIACCFLASPVRAQPLADFYKGKQIRLIVGTESGQDYDTWARLVARHMRQYVPGNPAFVVENMPSAGSLIAANHLYNKAAQDGTTLGTVRRNIPYYPPMLQPNPNYDPLKFNW